MFQSIRNGKKIKIMIFKYKLKLVVIYLKIFLSNITHTV